MHSRYLGLRIFQNWFVGTFYCMATKANKRHNSQDARYITIKATRKKCCDIFLVALLTVANG